MNLYVSSYNEFQKEMSNFGKIVKGKVVDRLKYIYVAVDGETMTLTGTNGYQHMNVWWRLITRWCKVEFTIPIETAKVFKKVKGDARLKIELECKITLFSYDNQTITAINDPTILESYPTNVSQILHDKPKNNHRLKVDAKLLIDILRSFDTPYIVVDLDSRVKPIHIEETKDGKKNAVVLPMRFSDE